ncbi:peptidylprolyl isomerase [Rhodocytophaga rosea]|uniref:Peptidyl-prolyl cis-trans isomerase n=1 Tax=Rhodocytophaga rosea TaxID=2704465 RepID=A0A6C0GGN2_9BACT|nr:peptidylprolyl isomerase [Rhodocytophaga rosea]QHT66892.1 peptidylprolyl isomerase [Rhodocytophaga rosea]
MKKLLILIFILAFTQLSFAQKKSKKDYLVTLSTEYGNMYLVLFDETPKHKANFIKLAEDGFYNGTLFHRIIDGFMIQGGDPNSKTAKPGDPLGNGDVGYTIPAEFNEKLFHKKGVIAAARDNNPQKASSGCQFYIAQGKVYKEEDFEAVERRIGRVVPENYKQVYKTIGGIPHLDQNYTVYGQVIKGLEIIDTIAKQPRNEGDRPNKDIPMQVSVKKMRKKKITKEFGYTF